MKLGLVVNRKYKVSDIYKIEVLALISFLDGVNNRNVKFERPYYTVTETSEVRSLLLVVANVPTSQNKQDLNITS